MKRHLAWALALGALQLLTFASGGRAEDNGGVSVGDPPDLAIMNVPYDHLIAGHKQVLVVIEPYDRRGVIVRNLGTVPINNVSISQNGNNQSFYVAPSECAGVTLQPQDECMFVVQWIPIDGGKRVFNDVVTVSGESETEQHLTALFLKAVQE
jgi:hypothetical protein